MQSKKRGCRYFLNLGLFSIIAMLIGYLILQFIAHPYILSYGYSHPGRVSLEGYSPADFGLAYEDVELQSHDGIILKGWFLPSQNGRAIILMHSLGANRLGTMQQALMLQNADYGVLLFDLRAHGESGGEILSYGQDEALDVIAAADYLEARGLRIATMGLSLGANFAVFGAMADKRIEAVIAEGLGGTVPSDLEPQPFMYQIYDPIFFTMLNWQTGVSEPISVGEAVEALTVPLFLIGAPFEVASLEIHAARNPLASLWVVPNVGHIAGISNPDYTTQVLSFLETSMPE